MYADDSLGYLQQAAQAAPAWDEAAIQLSMATGARHSSPHVPPRPCSLLRKNLAVDIGHKCGKPVSLNVLNLGLQNNG